jgi:alkylation response protein AidB-like acyl-CoA dehydrogenase
MDFDLSEEQEMLQATVRSYAENECPPQTVRAVFDGDRSGEPGLWKGLAEMGVAGLVVPEAYGGAGLELLDLALVSEELGRAAVPGPFLGHALASLAIRLGGSEAQKERWLPLLASGEGVGSVAWAEEGRGFEPSALETRLSGGKLSGRKSLVPGAAEAGVFVVLTADGTLAITEASADGVALHPMPSIDRGRPLADVHFEATPAEELPGRVADRVRDAGLVLLAADAFGAGHHLIRMAVDYANTRQQFGQPIAQFQGVKHQLANMAVDVDPTRGLWWFAAHAFDHEPEQAERAAALAKAHITDRALQAARDAVEIHGGLGFTWECDVQLWFKRTLFDRLWLGSPEVHRERLATLGGW